MYWCDRALIELNCYYTVVLNEDQLDDVSRHLKLVKKDSVTFPAFDGARCNYLISPRGQHVTVVTMTGWLTKKTAAIVGLLAHEATHIFEAYLEYIGERDPSPEFRAYSIQNITQELYTAYEYQKRDIKRKAKRVEMKKRTC